MHYNQLPLFLGISSFVLASAVSAAAPFCSQVKGIYPDEYSVNMTSDLYVNLTTGAAPTPKGCVSGGSGIVLFNVTNTTIPLPYYNATINTLNEALTTMSAVNASFDGRDVTPDGSLRHFCTEPEGEDKCLYFHIGPRNITFNVSNSLTLQQQENLPPVSTYPVKLSWGIVGTIVDLLKNANGEPKELSFNITSPWIRTDTPFAAGCLNFDPVGC